jgi:hypothetical protein
VQWRTKVRKYESSWCASVSLWWLGNKGNFSTYNPLSAITRHRHPMPRINIYSAPSHLTGNSAATALARRSSAVTSCPFE